MPWRETGRFSELTCEGVIGLNRQGEVKEQQRAENLQRTEDLLQSPPQQRRYQRPQPGTPGEMRIASIRTRGILFSLEMDSNYT
jgi:hypothetical protein